MTREQDARRGGREGGTVHRPVMPVEVIEAVFGGDRVPEEGWVIDGTVGAGGHAQLILDAAPGIRLLGIDQDPDILEVARGNLETHLDRGRVRLVHGRLTELGDILSREGLPRPVAMLLDLGASSLQLDRAERGFSFQADGPLDMRMDPRRQRTAAEIVNTWDEEDLADLFFYEGDERRARGVARAIVEGRRRVPFQRTAALADLIARSVPGGGRIHPATRSFQALRRAVNEEGDELDAGLAAAERWLANGGRLAVISFHSGEDRAVKRFLAGCAKDGSFERVSKKPTRPSRQEERANRRSRSARLRAAIRRRSLEEPGGDDVAAPGGEGP